jgi:hypothetical protein
MIILITFLLLSLLNFSNKININLALIHKKAIFYIIFLVFVNKVNAQDTLKTALNSTIPFVFTPNTYNFDVEYKKNKKIRLDSEKMNQYIFKNPGITKIYPLSIHKHDEGHDHDCSVIHLPEMIIVLTDNYKMEFLDSTFKISRPIVKNQSTKGSFVEIQVNVIGFEEQNSFNISNIRLHTAGIGTNIIGTLDPNFTKLKKGLNTLRYNLEGSCTMNSYIQFDFIDNVGAAHSISLHSPIKDN